MGVCVSQVLLTDVNVAADLVDGSCLADMSDGFSGSDMKAWCSAAAMRPVRELLNDTGMSRSTKSNKQFDKFPENPGDWIPGDSKAEKPSASTNILVEWESLANTQHTPKLRPLCRVDFETARSEIGASVNRDSRAMNELRAWNDAYGDGHARHKPTLSYFM